MIANLNRRYEPKSVSPFMRKLDDRSYDVLKVDLRPGPMYIPGPSSVCLSAKVGMGHEDERTFTHNPWVAGGLLVEREGNEMRDLSLDVVPHPQELL